MRKACILLLLSLPIAVQQASSPQAETETKKLWAAFELTDWGSPFANWSGLHQEIPCEEFHGSGWRGDAEGQWTQRCSASPQPPTASWSFYIFNLQPPLVCRLEQFDASTSTLPVETLNEVQQLLQDRIAARYGLGEDDSPKILRARAVPWPEYVRWRTDDLEIHLNLSEFDPNRKEGRLTLLARHKTLLDALTEDERLNRTDPRPAYAGVGTPIDLQLADQLRADFPKIATLLTQSQPPPDPAKVREAIERQIQSQRNAGQTGVRGVVVAVPMEDWEPEEFHDAMMQLLESVKTSPHERQPILLFAADRLAVRLPNLMRKGNWQAPEWEKWREQFANYGVNYKESVASPEENPWVYTNNLLWRVWKDYADTDWGERAFLFLLSQGWDTGVDCEAGSDQFHAVIQHGEEFLAQHPTSPYRLSVQLAVAQAYETSWSLSQASTQAEEPDADPAQYQKGAREALAKSINYFERILQTAPESDQAAYARRELPRLKLGIDTNQRRFYCIVGD